MVVIVTTILAVILAAAPSIPGADRAIDQVADTLHQAADLVDVSLSAVVAASADTDGDGLLNGFEVRWGITNPSRADSDGDGLLDSAEDTDGDGLSNYGEQLFGTDPAKRDTNGNGIDDAHDDANGDGVPDGRQQDRRPVPNDVSPSLSTASTDFRCYKPGDAGGPCIGDSTATISVALYGDSHAAQWAPALNLAAIARHWRLSVYANEHCPSVHVPISRECGLARHADEKSLRADLPDLIIITNFSHYDVTPRQWSDGLKATLAALPATSRVMVLADTPLFNVDVPTCLERHPRNIGTCEVQRSVGISASHNRLEASIARANGATFASMNPWMCPYELCPVIVGNLLIWRDSHHMTVTYSRQLAPAFGALVARALRGQ